MDKNKKTYKRKCAYCGKEFEVFSLKSNKKYCCVECREKMYERIYPQKEEIREIRKCAYCGKEFEWSSKKPNQKYCSSDCRENAVRNRNKFFGGDKKLEELYSIVQLKVTSIIKRSFEQGNIQQDKLLDYWKLNALPESVKTEALERDHYECQICKKREDLHVHHIIKRKEGGSHSLDNLITLCSSCHRHIETRDIPYAIKKCFNNAKENYFRKTKISPTKKYDLTYINILENKLKSIFNTISKANANGEYNDILIKIDEILDKLY